MAAAFHSVSHIAGFSLTPLPLGASLVAQMVKNLPAMWEAQVQSLGWEDPLELRLLSRFSRVRLCDLMDCSPPGSSVHGIFQARVLEWGAIAFSDPLEKEMQTHSSILAWGILRTEEPDGLESMGWQLDRTERLTLALLSLSSPLGGKL